MSALTGLKLAIGSLQAHRTRSLLTTLGVVIGVFIISLVLIVSGGLHAGVSEQAEKLNSNILSGLILAEIRFSQREAVYSYFLI